MSDYENQGTAHDPDATPHERIGRQAPPPPFKYVCSHCGSDDVLRDAWASWNPDARRWECDEVFDEAHCCQCDGRTSLKTVPYTPPSEGDQ